MSEKEGRDRDKPKPVPDPPKPIPTPNLDVAEMLQVVSDWLLTWPTSSGMVLESVTRFAGTDTFVLTVKRLT